MKAVLFDFGGTLDSNGIHWSKQFYLQYQCCGIPIDQKQFDKAFVEADKTIVRSYDVRNYSLKKLLELQVHLQFEHLHFSDPTREKMIVEGCHQNAKKNLERNCEILKRLHPRFRLGVVSNFNGNLDVVCKEFHLDQVLDLILDSAVVGVSKPDPEIFQIALKRLQVKPEECFFVGDSFERDIIPANSVGLKTIWLQGENPRVEFDTSKANYIIKSLIELESILNERRS